MDTEYLALMQDMLSNLDGLADNLEGQGISKDYPVIKEGGGRKKTYKANSLFNGFTRVGSKRRYGNSNLRTEWGRQKYIGKNAR